MAKLADVRDLGSRAAWRVGSSPTNRTKQEFRNLNDGRFPDSCFFVLTTVFAKGM